MNLEAFSHRQKHRGHMDLLFLGECQNRSVNCTSIFTTAPIFIDGKIKEKSEKNPPPALGLRSFSKSYHPSVCLCVKHYTKKQEVITKNINHMIYCSFSFLQYLWVIQNSKQMGLSQWHNQGWVTGTLVLGVRAQSQLPQPWPLQPRGQNLLDMPKGS